MHVYNYSINHSMQTVMVTQQQIHALHRQIWPLRPHTYFNIITASNSKVKTESYVCKWVQSSSGSTNCYLVWSVIALSVTPFCALIYNPTTGYLKPVTNYYLPKCKSKKLLNVLRLGAGKLSFFWSFFSPILAKSLVLIMIAWML